MPQFNPDSKYIGTKRGSRMGHRSSVWSSPGSGGGGGASVVTYLNGVTIDGATVTDDIDVDADVTIDGRDLSDDGAALDAHIAASIGVHGLTGTVVGNSDTQTLTNKTIVVANNTVTTASSGNLAATELNTALAELQTDIDTRALDSDLTTVETNLSNHISDATDAHDASAISNVPSGNLAATDVQAALNELQTDVDTRALDSALTAHVGDTTDAHDASAISVVATGNLAATDVQAALQELQGDIDGLTTLADGKIYVGNGSNVATEVTPTGDVTITNAGVTAIGANKVVNTMLAQMATNTIKGNNTGGSADPSDLTATQVTAMLNVMVGDSGSGGTKGLVPAPASGDAGKALTGAGTYVTFLSSPMTTEGDIIYGASAGAAARLASPTKPFRFLKGGITAAPSYDMPAQAYVGTDPEVGGSTPFQLLVSHRRHQVINPSGAITVKLPTTDVEAGEVFTIQNRSTNLVTIQSSGANDIYAVNNGVVVLVALQATPTTAAHWEIVRVEDTLTGTVGSSGSFSSGGDYKITRSGKVVTMIINTAMAHSSSNNPTSATGVIPAKFQPAYSPVTLNTWDSSIIQLASVTTAGAISISYKDWAGSNSSQTTTKAGFTLTWTV